MLTLCSGRIALSAECKGPELKRYLSLLDADEFIEATACGDDMEHGQPDPRGTHRMMRKRLQKPALPLRACFRAVFRPNHCAEQVVSRLRTKYQALPRLRVTGPGERMTGGS